MRMMDVDKLKPHPKNNYFFDDIEGEPWTAFLESIETSGVIEPVIVDASDLTIISGHQRVRACKVLGIKQVAVEERGFCSEDERLKQLIETNIRQRGIGNGNPVKFGRCIAELERIYGIRNGGDRKSDGHNVQVKTQDDLAEELEISKRQMARYKSLTDLIPELQEAVESGKITQTVAMGVVKKLSPTQQKELAESIGLKEKVSGKEIDSHVAEIKAKDLKIAELEQQNSSLHAANKILAKQANQKEVVREPVEVEIIPDDYEDLKKKVSDYEAKEAADEFNRFVASADVFTNRFKTGLPFERLNNLPVDIKKAFASAVKEISEFVNDLEKRIGEL